MLMSDNPRAFSETIKKARDHAAPLSSQVNHGLDHQQACKEALSSLTLRATDDILGGHWDLDRARGWRGILTLPNPGGGIHLADSDI